MYLLTTHLLFPIETKKIKILVTPRWILLFYFVSQLVLYILYRGGPTYCARQENRNTGKTTQFLGNKADVYQINGKGGRNFLRQQKTKMRLPVTTDLRPDFQKYFSLEEFLKFLSSIAFFGRTISAGEGLIQG